MSEEKSKLHQEITALILESIPNFGPKKLELLLACYDAIKPMYHSVEGSESQAAMVSMSIALENELLLTEDGVTHKKNKPSAISFILRPNGRFYIADTENSIDIPLDLNDLASTANAMGQHSSQENDQQFTPKDFSVSAPSTPSLLFNKSFSEFITKKTQHIYISRKSGYKANSSHDFLRAFDSLSEPTEDGTVTMLDPKGSLSIAVLNELLSRDASFENSDELDSATNNINHTSNSIIRSFENSFLEELTRFSSEAQKLVSNLLREAFDASPAQHNSPDKQVDFLLNDIPVTVLNFILSVDGENDNERARKRANRLLFVDAYLTLARWSNDPKHIDDISAGISLQNLLSSFKDLRNLLSEVDSGFFPYDAIRENFSAQGMSNKQISLAIKYHNASLGRRNNERKELIRDESSLFTSPMIFDETLLLAKIPKDWLTYTASSGKSFNVLLPSTDEELTLLKELRGDHKEMNPEQSERKSLNLILSFLTSAGAEINGLDKRLSASKEFGEDYFKQQKIIANKSKKEIARQWAWLSKKDNPIEAFALFEKEFKISAELRDYENILSKLAQGIIKRIFHDLAFTQTGYSQIAPKSLFDINDSGEITTKNSEVAALLYNITAEADSSYIYDLDDDHRDYLYHNNNDSDLSAFDPNNYTSDLETDIDLISYRIRECAEKSRRLHVNISRINKSLASHSTTNVTWVGLIEKPEEVDGYLFHPITDRRTLLSEGVEMNHCVYSYLSDCIQGNTSIFSVTNKEGDRLATVEIQQSSSGYGYGYGYEMDDDEDPTPICTIQQMYGYGNSALSRDVRDACDEFLSRLNHDSEYTLTQEVRDIYEENSDNDDIDFDDFESIADSDFVPFLTNAVYTAYEVLSEYLPSNISLYGYLESFGEIVTESLHHSEFGNIINAMEHVRQIHGLSAHEISTIAQNLDGRLNLHDVIEPLNICRRIIFEQKTCRQDALLLESLSEDSEMKQHLEVIAEDYNFNHDDENLDLWLEENEHYSLTKLSTDTFRVLIRNIIDKEGASNGIARSINTIKNEYQSNKSTLTSNFRLFRERFPDSLDLNTVLRSSQPDTLKELLRLNEEYELKQTPSVVNG